MTLPLTSPNPKRPSGLRADPLPSEILNLLPQFKSMEEIFRFGELVGRLKLAREHSNPQSNINEGFSLDFANFQHLMENGEVKTEMEIGSLEDQYLTVIGDLQNYEIITTPVIEFEYGSSPGVFGEPTRRNAIMLVIVMVAPMESQIQEMDEWLTETYGPPPTDPWPGGDWWKKSYSNSRSINCQHEMVDGKPMFHLPPRDGSTWPTTEFDVFYQVTNDVLMMMKLRFPDYFKA